MDIYYCTKLINIIINKYLEEILWNMNVCNKQTSYVDFQNFNDSGFDCLIFIKHDFWEV